MRKGRYMRWVYRMIHYVLYAEMMIFGLLYVWSPNGVQPITHLMHEYKEIEEQVINLKRDIASLDGEIASWEHDPFYQEQIAREQLQMARKDEVIYYTK